MFYIAEKKFRVAYIRCSIIASSLGVSSVGRNTIQKEQKTAYHEETAAGM